MMGENVLPHVEVFQYTIIKLYLIAFFTVNISGFSYTFITLKYKLRKQNEHIQQTRV